MNPLQIRLSRLFLLASFLLIPESLPGAVDFDDGVPQVVFAAGEVERALEESGRSGLEVSLAIEADETSPESFRVETDRGKPIRVIGTDAKGAMYGGLEVADRIRFGLPIEAMERTPFIGKRGIKMNIPWDARTPSYDDTGDSAQNNIETIWDFEFWKAYLDDLARYRYNVLSLWSTHPYPNLVKLEDYPEATIDDVYRIKDGLLKPEHKNKLQDLDQNGDGYLDLEHDLEVLELVKEVSIDEKIAHWQRVFQYAEDRGIEVYLFHWTVFAFGAIDKHGITEDQTNATTVDYLRKCVAEVLRTYPNVKGLGVCAGENADKKLKGKHSTENYIFDTFGRGIMDVKEEDPERDVRLIIRRHATEEYLVTDAFKDRYTGGELDTSVKYAVAHMYSSRRPQEWERRIIEEGWLENYKVWLNLRNDDIFMHRWGSPGYVREFIKWMPHENSPGFYMGSDGYVWAREFIDKSPELAGRLEIDKHWYRFRLWGQLAYDNELGREYWEAALAHRFPGVDAAKLYEAWETVSEVIPQLNRSVWSATDAAFAAEGAMERDGFLTVDTYQFAREAMPLSRIENGPDSQCLTVTEWAQAILAEEEPEGLTPLQIAENLDGYAEEALARLPALQVQADGNAELQATLDDIESMAYLGRYFADKMRGAAKLAVFRQDRERLDYHAEAVAHFEDAVEEWRTYAALLTPRYKTSLTARTHYLDWNRTLEEVESELAAVKREGDFPKIRFTNLEDGARLHTGSDLRVEIEAKDTDGIARVRLYLNGLLLEREDRSGSSFAWSASSDELLKRMKAGPYELVALAEDASGTSGRRKIQFSVGKFPKQVRADRWKDDVHEVILEEGERIHTKDEMMFPRLECKLRMNEGGKLVLTHPDEGMLFGTWSKDDGGVHFAALEGGQLRCHRVTPGEPEVVLWESKVPDDDEEGPFQLGITASRRLIVFSEKDGKRETVWRSPEQN